MPRRKIQKPKSKIERKKLNIYPAKKDIKNKKIAEIFQILGIGEDSKEENNQEVKDNDEIKKNIMIKWIKIII